MAPNAVMAPPESASKVRRVIVCLIIVCLPLSVFE